MSTDSLIADVCKHKQVLQPGYLCKRRLLGSGNVSCIAECIAFARASFRSISSEDSHKEIKLLKTQANPRQFLHDMQAHQIRNLA